MSRKRREILKLSCLHCKKIFETKIKTRKFCSIKCFAKNCEQRQLGENNTCYRHGNNVKGKIHYCIENCGQKVSAVNRRCRSCSTRINQRKFWSNTKNKKKIIEKRVKNGIFKLHRNPRWLNGKSFDPYPFDWNKNLKDNIRKRDQYTCQLCGLSQKKNKRKLNVHHIDYNKKNCKEENLISLCDRCHTKTNSSRAFYKKYLKIRRYQ